MPTIFDNIEQKLFPALQETLKVAYRADFCVGYFNLRGWGLLEDYVNDWAGGDGACCRLMIGMQSLPQDELKSLLRLTENEDSIDNNLAIRLKRKMAEEFRTQLTIGAPTARDEASLRLLSAQLKAHKVVVKLHLRHQLHAKLYLLYRDDFSQPKIGYLGSSNLTMSGLQYQGELNIDVPDKDAATKLEKWFNDRWDDKFCLDISEDLATIIDNSWAREVPIPPYHIYLKMAYHLSNEARAGLAEYAIPREFGKRLLDFQVAAVKIAAHHLNKRGGVIIGDVVGLGKTLMATALARIFQDDYGMDTLIISPKNLTNMWEDYVDKYGLRSSKVLSSSICIKVLPDLRRYKLVLIDESHNLRNRESKRFKAIQEYIEKNDSKCILLTATPYNKTFLDLSAQLRLFIQEGKDLGIRPEKLIGTLGELGFNVKYQAAPRSLAAFEKSEFIDDWRELMRLYMVRRTRSFIIENYSTLDQTNGRRFLTFEDGSHSYFPARLPRTLKFNINDTDPTDQYGRLYAEEVVNSINSLSLPRYGLGNYVVTKPNPKPNDTEKKQLDNLGRAGQRLMGFCRTNLFKRLESGGPAFIESIERHILRNYIFFHALENGLDIPLGTQEAELLDPRCTDEDAEIVQSNLLQDEDETETPETPPDTGEQADLLTQTEAEYKKLAAKVYDSYAKQYRRRFKWLRSNLFAPKLKADLQSDARALLGVRQRCGNWNSNRDTKLIALLELLTKTHSDKKVLIFTQFADTVRYLTTQFKARGITALAGVTGDSDDPTALAWKFSPTSNEKRDKVPPENEIRVLIATDVLSEGQNLQDAAIVVNYDLPWAIIRLIQRAGRVDRIGQKAEEILCYTFLPADGVERIIRLRERVRRRLRENAEVVGTDETFFEDDADDQTIVNLYNEKSGILDGDADTEVDLASYAYQIWKNATDQDSSLKGKIAALPDVVYSTRQYIGTPLEPQGALIYVRTPEGNDSLAWFDQQGNTVTQSQLAILKAAECSPNTPAIPRYEHHHELVTAGVKQITQDELHTGGQLGRPGGARYRTYQRLLSYAEKLKGTLWENTEDSQTVLKIIDQIYNYPLRSQATDTLNRQLKSGIDDEKLVNLVLIMYREDRLCVVHDENETQEPKIICSLGLYQGA